MCFIRQSIDIRTALFVLPHSSVNLFAFAPHDQRCAFVWVGFPWNLGQNTTNVCLYHRETLHHFCWCIVYFVVILTLCLLSLCLCMYFCLLNYHRRIDFIWIHLNNFDCLNRFINNMKCFIFCLKSKCPY